MLWLTIIHDTRNNERESSLAIASQLTHSLKQISTLYNYATTVVNFVVKDLTGIRFFLIKEAGSDY